MPSRVSQTDPRGAFPQSSFKHTPLEHIETLLISFIQQLFSYAPVGSYHWTPDETSELYISASAPVHVRAIGQRPAVTITCGPVQFSSVGLDDMSGYHFETGQKEKTVLVAGTLSINCSARTSIQSRQIAWVIWEHIWLLRELLLRAGFFDIGRMMAIGATTSAEQIIVGDAGDEWVSTPVFCPFQFSRTSSFVPLGQQIVRGIEAAMSTAYGAPLGQGVPAAAGPELPYAQTALPPPAFVPGASDAHGRTPNPGGFSSDLPLARHPLNPSQLVTVRVARGTRVGARLSQQSPGLPITEGDVEQSPQPAADAQRFKV